MRLQVHRLQARDPLLRLPRVLPQDRLLVVDMTAHEPVIVWSPTTGERWMAALNPGAEGAWYPLVVHGESTRDLPGDVVRFVAEPGAELEQRLDELAALQEGWDGYGASPMQPGIRERVIALLGHLRGEPHVGLAGGGGAYLFWGADEDVIVELGPGGTVTALIEDRDLAEPLHEMVCPSCGATIRARMADAPIPVADDEGVERAQVSRLWAEDWDSAEDAAYDLPRRDDDVAVGLKRECDRIYAPFTDAEQAALNAFQRDGRMHPFTCPDHSDQPLLAERHWRCLECDYTQYWAHAFMAETPTPIEETDHG